jgi:hypothetical protein
MAAFAALKHLDAIKDLSSSLIPGCIDLSPNAVTLEQLKKLSATAL